MTPELQPLIIMSWIYKEKQQSPSHLQRHEWYPREIKFNQKE